MQRFSLKHLQKVESNKSLSAKNDKDQQLQLRQAEKDYYELFEALADRDKANSTTPSPFAVFLQQQSQAQYGTSSGTGELSGKAGITSGVRLDTTAPVDFDLSLAEDKSPDNSGDEEKETTLDDFIPGRRSNRAIEELSAPSTKKTPMFSPIENGAFMSPPLPGGADRTSSSETATGLEGTRLRSVTASSKRNARISVQTPASAAARSLKLSRRGLSSKFDEEGGGQGNSIKIMPSAEHAHDKVYHNWATRSLSNIPVHSAMSVSMDRTNEVLIDHHAFCRRFDQECRRSFEHVHTLSGVLEVTPMQALHLPEAKNPMLVRVSYGDQVRIYFYFIFEPTWVLNSIILQLL